MYAGFLFFQAEDGIRDLVRSRGLGDVYKRQMKKITELSTLAIRLNDIYNSLTQNPIDFLKVSDLSLIHI